MSFGIDIVVTVEDKRGRKSTTMVRVPEGTTKPHLTFFAAAFCDAIDLLIGGVIRGAVAIVGCDISGLTGNTAASNSDVEEIAAAQFESEAFERVQVNIPSVNETLVTNDTGDLNLSATAVAAFEAMMVDGISIGGSLIIPVDVGELEIDHLVFFRERSRNSGKRKVNG